MNRLCYKFLRVLGLANGTDVDPDWLILEIDAIKMNPTATYITPDPLTRTRTCLW